MDDQYPLSDLRHLLSTAPPRPHFPSSSSIPHHDLSSAFRHHHTPYDLIMMMPRDTPLPDFRSDSTTTPSAPIVSAQTVHNAFEPESASIAADCATARWPRQETLTLLEIRSRLDSKFKEANQKGPLWDEVSRIMAEEHNYQRSGKKCREKFENLYKYYKKTKEGKAGRQDGKNYRFFRQLEALYGETSNSPSLPDSHFVGDTNLRFQQNGTKNPTASAPMSHEAHQKHYCDSLSLSNTSEFETSASSDGNDDLGSVGVMDNDSMEKRRKKRGGKCWKAKIKQFIDSQMRKLIDKQEAWLEKLMKTLEQKEKERMIRDEEWRRQEVSRMDRERSFWAKERAWIESRDAALMDALQRLTGRELRDNNQYNSSPDHGLIVAEHHRNNNENQNEDGSEILNNNTARELLADNNDNYQRKIIDNHGNKKRKENSTSTTTTTYNLYFQQQTDSSLYSRGGGGPYDGATHIKEQSPNSSNAGASGGGHVVQDNCFRFLMGEGDQSQSGLWENFGLKLNNGGDRT
ncbi:trihelix transcription factor PTL [Cucumis melo var. makuwa]|uniref:Trihelix transcription factor PTL n=3 Tax=Cucumis melo TaxID=3656 RepID=A0A5A7TKS4_CUCMM|nr:trihelix transcription factor PTL [Cucumis melo var. makuwa]